MTINLADLSVEQLKRAAQIKEQITKLQDELSAVFGSKVAAPKAAAKPSGMSAAARARLSAMGKARWAKIKAGTQAAATSKAPAKKGTMSAESRARLSALMKAKWAAKKKGSTQAPAKSAAAPAKKPTMSPAAKANLSALAKARWAKIKASGKKSF